MHVVDAFPGRAPTTGLLLAARVYNDAEDAWRENGEIVAWREGVQVRRSGCSGVHAHAVNCSTTCCPPPGVTQTDPGLCVEPAPGFEEFRAFRLSKAVCASGACEPGLYRSLAADFDAMKGYALAGVLHRGIDTNPGLQTKATNLSVAGPASVDEGLGALMRARAVSGVGGGWLHVPVYAAAKVAPTLSAMAAAFGGSPFEKVVLDYGYPTTGPAGVAAANGTAWLYVSGPVIVAISKNPLTPESADFMNYSTGCSTPIVDHAALVAWQTCGTYAVNVDLREKG